MTEIKDILQIVYLPDWNTHAYICKDGAIYIQIILGRCFTREKFIEFEKDTKHNREFINRRLKLYDDLEKYYIKHGQK